MVTKQQKLKRRLASFAAQHMPEATHSVLTPRDFACHPALPTGQQPKPGADSASSGHCLAAPSCSHNLSLLQLPMMLKPGSPPISLPLVLLWGCSWREETRSAVQAHPLYHFLAPAHTTDKGARFCQATCAQQARDTKPVIVMQRNFAFTAVKGISTC